jgi:hypothetical protein
MKRVLAFAVVVLLAFMAALPVSAQGEMPYVIRSTRPISTELKAMLDAWLSTDAPSTAPYYIVTYAKQKTGRTFVSLVGVDLPSPESDWDLEEGGSAIVWMGSVNVSSDGTVSLFQPEQAMTNSPVKRAVFSPAPGGGSYIAFPFQAGTGMLYGPRAVHGSGDYGTSGMLAVDLVSGDDMGASAAPPYVYASDAGEIDFVCEDDTTVAVRTHNADTGDYFLYAHLLSNENLESEVTFEQGELMGSLKYGTFDDDCGWAEQQPDHYHIHWMFVPANGAYQAEGCVLSIATKKWTCGTETIGTGGWIVGGGGFGVGEDDIFAGVSGTGVGVSNERSFWDYMLIGAVSVFDRGLLKLLPEHTSPTLAISIVFNIVTMVLQTAWVLVRFNINLGPLMACLIFAIGFRLVCGGIFMVGAIMRTVKGVPLIP